MKLLFPPPHSFLCSHIWQNPSPSCLEQKNLLLFFFKGFSDDLSMGNWAKPGPSAYSVNQTENKDDSLSIFFFMFNYSLHSLTRG